jgi:peptidoglycan-associated lipoprotein
MKTNKTFSQIFHKSSRVAVGFAAAVSMAALAGCAHKVARPDQDLSQADAASSSTLAPLNLKLVHFGFNSSELTATTKATLRSDAQALIQDPKATVQIQGYCDDRGSANYNMALGERRADAVRAYMHDLGISPNRISVISFGKEDPIDPAHSEVAYAKNRRAQFSIRSNG